jgi:hypothetical protein
LARKLIGMAGALGSCSTVHPQHGTLCVDYGGALMIAGDRVHGVDA